MNDKIFQCWIKKLISKQDWNSWYSKNSSYCFLRHERDMVWVGFLIGDVDHKFIPDGCFSLTDEELRQVNFYRRSHNTSPFPLKDIYVAKKTISQKTSEALKKLGIRIKGLSNKLSVINEKTDQQRLNETIDVSVPKQGVNVEDLGF